VNERPQATWRIGNWQVSPSLGEISRDGRSKKLDHRAMRLLMFLAERPGQVVAITELLDGVWSKAVVTPNSVYEAIAALRQALEDPADQSEYIVTLPRRGYRLVARVERDSEHPADQAVDQSRATVPTTEVSPASPVPVPRQRSRIPAAGAVLAIAVIGALAWWYIRATHSPSPRRQADKSIAVLPFLDLSEKRDQEYFADGLAEELLDVLANVPGLRVIGRTSSFQFRNKNEGIPSIAAKLGASYVVEGSVRRVGDHVRVAMQLIRAADGTHHWSQTFDRNLSDTLQLEDQLAESLGRALELSVVGALASNSIETSNPDANDHYLRGLHALDSHTASGTEDAANEFLAAIALDPKFTAAHVSLGVTHLTEAEYGFVTPEAGFPRARDDAAEAIALNPRSAIAHALLARVAILYTWDWDEARRESDAALALAPQSPFVLLAAAELADIFADTQQAERLIRASLVSDPLDPEAHFMLGDTLLSRGRLQDAEAELRRCLEISPNYAFAHFSLSYVLSLQGREDSVTECQRELPEGGQFPCLATAYDRLGRRKDADVALQSAIEQYGDTQAFWIATIFADRQDAARALEWLERSYRQREPAIEFLKTTRDFDGLKDDPRYRSLVEKMHFPN
jgi:adenylate cyclase